MFKFLIVVMVLLSTTFSYGKEGMMKAIQDAFEFYSVGNFEDAAPLFDEAALIMRHQVPKDMEGRLRVSLYAALSYKESGDYQNAYKWFTDALSIAGKIGDKVYAVKILSYLAETERFMEAYDKSIEAYNKAIKSGLPTEKDMAALYYGLAESYRLSGKFDEALAACESSSVLSKKYAFDKLILSCNIVEGESYRMKGDYAKSLQIFGVAYDTARARNYYDISIAALNGMGLVSEFLGRQDAARDRFEESLNLSFKNGLLDNIPLISQEIISLIPDKGSFTAKGDDIAEMAKSLDPFIDYNVRVSLLKLATAYYKAARSYDNILICSENIYSEAVSGGQEDDAVIALYNMAESLYYLEKYGEAASRADESLARAKAAKITKNISKIYALKAECFVKMGYFEDGAVIMKEAYKNEKDYEIKKKYDTRLKEIIELSDSEKINGRSAEEIIMPENIESLPVNSDMELPAIDDNIS